MQPVSSKNDMAQNYAQNAVELTGSMDNISSLTEHLFEEVGSFKVKG
jgi:hypothetical protein